MALITRTYTFTDGTTAYGSQVDSEILNIVTIINSCNAGTTTWGTVKVTTLLPQANVAMGGFKLTGLANGSAATDSVTYSQLTAIAGAITGSLLMYPVKTPPTGYLYCDGSLVSRGTYATLYGVVGNIFGSGDGSTTFALPDYRGKFVRGVNDSTGNDPDAASRTAQSSGGNTGDNPGSIQVDQFKSHTHVATPTDPGHVHQEQVNTANGGNSHAIADAGNNNGGVVAVAGPLNTVSAATGITVANASTGGNESRPLNSSIYFFIKT